MGMRSITDANNPRERRHSDVRREGKSYESGVKDVLGVYQGSQFEGKNYNNKVNYSDYNSYGNFDQQLQSFNDQISEPPVAPNNNLEDQRRNRRNNIGNNNSNNNNELNNLRQQMNNFMGHQQRTESTVKWLSDQLQKNRSDYAKHTAMVSSGASGEFPFSLTKQDSGLSHSGTQPPPSWTAR